MIVISEELALSSGYQPTANNPLIGYRSLATITSIAASTEADTDPATNLANPSTYLRWTATQFAADELLTVSTPGGADIDYVAIAGHNFGTLGATISIEAADTLSMGDPDFDEVIVSAIPAHDGPLMFRFASRNLLAIRVRIEYPTSADAPARAAVLYVGEALTLQRRLYVGHAPMPMARVSEIANGRSESGQFLGRIVLATKVATTVEIKNLTPDWVREHFNPFLKAAIDAPFFFAWRPADYPDEVGYGWLADDVRPINDLPNGMMAATFSIDGVA